MTTLSPSQVSEIQGRLDNADPLSERERLDVETIRSLLSDRTSLLQRVAALEGALGPFAKEADSYENDVRDTLPLFAPDEDGDPALTHLILADLRAARAALATGRREP